MIYSSIGLLPLCEVHESAPTTLQYSAFTTTPNILLFPFSVLPPPSGLLPPAFSLLPPPSSLLPPPSVFVTLHCIETECCDGCDVIGDCLLRVSDCGFTSLSFPQLILLQESSHLAYANGGEYSRIEHNALILWKWHSQAVVNDEPRSC